MEQVWVQSPHLTLFQLLSPFPCMALLHNWAIFYNSLLYWVSMGDTRGQNYVICIISISSGTAAAGLLPFKWQVVCWCRLPLWNLRKWEAAFWNSLPSLWNSIWQKMYLVGVQGSLIPPKKWILIVFQSSEGVNAVINYLKKKSFLFKRIKASYKKYYNWRNETRDIQYNWLKKGNLNKKLKYLITYKL